MRGLLLLISIVGFMGLILVWKFQTDPSVEASSPPPDPSTGRVVVGLPSPGPEPALPSVDSPVVEPPYQPTTPEDPVAPTPGPGGEEASPERLADDRQPAEPVAPQREPLDTRVHYTVSQGDTLYGILRRTYGVAKPELVEAVAAANQLDDAGALEIGQRLALPVVPGFPAPELP